MIVFASLAGVLLLLSIAVVLWPLWRVAPTDVGSRREANIAVYEQHTAEIEREMASGQISGMQADARREELGARLLDDVESAPSAAADSSSSRPWTTSAIVVVGFSVLAIGLYSVLGDLRGVSLDAQPNIDQLVKQMEARLSEVPGDVRTRALLARVQMTRHDYAAAARTLAGINKRVETPDATYLAAEARARVLANDGLVNERAQALYEKVLTLSPHNVEALWFAGLAALADDNKQTAIKRWQTLLEQDISEEFRAKVQRRLAEVRGTAPELLPGN